jgi:riboflavin kinase/FMN adenylyltransferase
LGLQQQIATIENPDGTTCVTVGTFDGVHIGHQALLQQLASVATQREARSVALSFRQPPRSIIDPSRQTPHLYDAEKRVALIEDQGVDIAHLIDFDDEIRTMSAKEFLTTLQESLGMTNLVIGERAVLGHDRRNAQQITEIAYRVGIELHLVSPVSRSDLHVSSSSIRHALAQGDVKSAADMLGRLYERGGNVVHGRARARELGVPTANMQWSRELVMPAHGIYTTWAKLQDGRVLPSGTYIGDNPTFGGNSPAFEVHIADFEEDLYGQYVSVEFIEFIRGDDAFDSVEELEAQIQIDIQRINQIFANLKPPN